MKSKIANDAEIDTALFGFAKLGVNRSGWETLYVDPATGTFWELTYPQSSVHGGGPRALNEIPLSEASIKYADVRDWSKPLSFTKIVQRPNVRSVCPACHAEGFDYQPGANPRDQFRAPVQCSKCGWNGMLGDRGLIAGN